MSLTDYRIFKPQRGFKQVRIFIIVFGLFVPAGIVPMTFGMIIPGIAVSGFGLLVLAIMISQAGAFGRSYGIGTEALLLKTAGDRKIISYDEISSAALMTEQQSKSYMEELYLSTVDAERQLDLGGWYRSNKRTSGVIRYLSVPVTGTDTRIGHSTNITAYSVRTGTGVILLRTLRGPFLISPVELREYFNELLKKGVENRPFIKGEGESVQAGTASKSSGKRRAKGLMIYGGIVFTLLVGYFIVYPEIRYQLDGGGEGIDNTAPAESVPEAGTQPLLCVWNDVNSFAFAVAEEELPEIVFEGGLTSEMYTAYAVPLVLRLLESEGELPEGASADQELIEKTGSFLLLHSRMSQAGEEPGGDGRTYRLFIVEQPGMKTNLPQLVRNFMKSE